MGAPYADAEERGDVGGERRCARTDGCGKEKGGGVAGGSYDESVVSEEVLALVVSVFSEACEGDGERMRSSCSKRLDPGEPTRRRSARWRCAARRRLFSPAVACLARSHSGLPAPPPPFVFVFACAVGAGSSWMSCLCACAWLCAWVTFCQMREMGSRERERGLFGSRDLERAVRMLPAPPRPEFSYACACGDSGSSGGLCALTMFARPPRPVECLPKAVGISVVEMESADLDTHTPSSEKGP